MDALSQSNAKPPETRPLAARTASASAVRFNRICAVLAAAWLLLSMRASLHHWPSDGDFPQFYMGGVMARAGAWDSIYPIPKPDSLNSAGLPEDSTMRPRYAQEAESHHVRDGTYFIQPPPVAILLEPLSFFSYQTAYRFWILLSIACAWGVAWMAGAGYELILGRRSRIAGLILLVVACSPLMHYAVRVANITVMVALLMGVAVVGIARGADAVPAAAGVLAGVLKYSTAPLLPLLAVMRRWKLLGWSALFAVLLCAATLMISGIGPFRTYLTEIFPTFSRTHHLEANQSISAFLIRVTHRDVLRAGLKAVFMSAEALTLIGLVWLMIRVPQSAWRRPLNVFAASTALLAFLLVFSPIFWAHYPVYLCPLWGYLAWEAGQSWRRFALVFVAVALTYVPLTAWLDMPEPWNTHILPSALLMMGLGAWRLSCAADESVTFEPPIYARLSPIAMTLLPTDPGSVVQFNRICRCVATGWLLLAVPLTFKVRPPIYDAFAQFYMGGVTARHRAWDALYPVPKPQSVYNPGLADDSDMRPRYAELAEETGVGDQPRFIQPPPDALIFEPLAFLSYRRARWVWVVIQCACALGISLMAGRFYELSAGRSSKLTGVVTLMAACSYLMYTTLRALNQEALISLLLGLAILEFATRVRRPLVAGLSLALGTLLKYVNVILLPIAIAARRWPVVAWFALGLAVALGGTYIVAGKAPFAEFGHIAPLLTRPYESEGNQSITGFLLRVTHRIPPLPAATVNAVRVIGAAAMLGILGLLFRRRPRDWQYPPLVFAAAAVLICWTLAFSPLTWNKYFLYLIPLWGWLAWEATQSRWRLVAVTLALMATWGPWEEIDRLNLHEPFTSHMLWGLVAIAVVAIARLISPAPSIEFERAAREDERAVLPHVQQ